MDAKKIFDDHIDKIVKEAQTTIPEASIRRGAELALLLRALAGASAGGLGGAGLAYLLGKPLQPTSGLGMGLGGLAGAVLPPLIGEGYSLPLRVGLPPNEAILNILTGKIR